VCICRRCVTFILNTRPAGRQRLEPERSGWCSAARYRAVQRYPILQHRLRTAVGHEGGCTTDIVLQLLQFCWVDTVFVGTFYPACLYVDIVYAWLAVLSMCMCTLAGGGDSSSPDGSSARRHCSIPGRLKAAF